MKITTSVLKVIDAWWAPNRVWEDAVNDFMTNHPEDGMGVDLGFFCIGTEYAL